MSQSEVDNSTQPRRVNMCLRSQVRSSPEDTAWEKVNQSHSNSLLDRGHMLISLEQSRFHRGISSMLASLPNKNNPLHRLNIRQTTGHYSSHQGMIMVLELLLDSSDRLDRRCMYFSHLDCRNQPNIASVAPPHSSIGNQGATVHKLVYPRHYSSRRGIVLVIMSLGDSSDQMCTVCNCLLGLSCKYQRHMS